MMLKDLVKKFGVLLVLTMLVAVCVGAGSAADWTTYQGNEQRTGYVADETGPQTNKTLWTINSTLWDTKGDGYLQAPVVSNGKIYVSVFHGQASPSIFCYDLETKEEVWNKSFYAKGGGRCGITVTEDYLYVGSYDGIKYGQLYCLNPDTGAIIGNTSVIANHGWVGLSSTAAVTEDTVWINSLQPETRLYGYSLDLKEEKYNISLPNATGSMYSSPSLSVDETVIYVPSNGGVEAYSTSTGYKLWTADFGLTYANGYQPSTPVYSNNVLYFTDGKSQLFAVNAETGDKIWNVSCNVAGKSTPAVTDSKIIVGTASGLSAYSLEGQSLWTYSGKSAASNSPIVVGDTVYYGGSSAVITAVNATDGTLVWTYDAAAKKGSNSNMFEGAPAYSDGVLYFADMQKLYAFSDSGNSEDDSGSGEDNPVTPPVESDEVLYDRTITVFNSTGTTATVKDALDVAAASGGFTYNLTQDNTIADINGIANAERKAWWTDYYNNGETEVCNVLDPVIKGATISIHYYEYTDDCMTVLDTEYLVNITVKDIQKPIITETIYDGKVTVTTSSGTATVKDALDAAVSAKVFTYNLTESDRIADINGITNSADWTESWMTAYYNNGNTPVSSVADSVIEGATISIHYDVLDSEWSVLATRYVVNVTVEKIEKTGGGTPVTPIIPPTPVINYVSINPGTGSFDYTTDDGNTFTVNRQTAFGVLYASSNSIQTSGSSGTVFVTSINGKSCEGSNGWMYTVNGNAPMASSAACTVSNGDKVIWYYSDSMESTPETSPVKYAFVVSLPAGTTPLPAAPTQTTNTTNTTNVTQVVLPPAEKVIPETKPIENTTGMVILEKTNTVKRIQVPVEILTENPNASVKVVEGNTEEVKLPANVTAENVHLILEVSVVDKEGEKISVDKPGHFILDAEVPAGKQILVGHFNETAGIWENCPVELLPNGQWKVTYYSLSPFSVLFLDEGKENPFVIIEAPEEPEQTEPDTTNETKPVETPAEEAKSPLAAAWLIPGIFALYAGLKRRNN